jgi:hypothetical protein
MKYAIALAALLITTPAMAETICYRVGNSTVCDDDAGNSVICYRVGNSIVCD